MEKGITKEEQRLFELELKGHLEAHAQFGPFEQFDSFRWFFLRGLDVANKLNQQKSNEIKSEIE